MMNESISVSAIQSQKILDYLDVGIIFSDQFGIISYANKAAGLMVGLSSDEMLNSPITDILTRLPLLASSDASAKGSQFELNGRYVHGQAITLYDQDDQAQGILTTLRDITAEYKAEQIKDNFLKTISHELRTPLTAVKGYVELLATGSSGPLNDNQKIFTTTIQRNVNRMVKLSNSLIFAASIKSGRLEHITGHTNLAQLIQQISRELQPIAAKDGQQIKINIDKKLQPLQVDPIHMATILEELMTNSIKFNRSGGIVEVTAVSNIDKENQLNFVVINVSDEGTGIPASEQAYIFEEFYRTEHNATHIRAQGLGLGLSMVKSIVEAYNGRIWFKSTPDKGSTFTFIIPNPPVDSIPPPTPTTPIS